MCFQATFYRNFLADCAVRCTQDALFWHFSVQACNRLRSRAQLAYLFRRLLLRASPRVLINCAVLCSASMRIPTSVCIAFTCIAITAALSSISSSFYPPSSRAGAAATSISHRDYLEWQRIEARAKTRWCAIASRKAKLLDGFRGIPGKSAKVDVARGFRKRRTSDAQPKKRR